MTADRLVLSSSRPLSLGAALAVSGGVVAGLIFFLAPQLVVRAPPPIFIADPIPLPQDPPPIEQPRTERQPRPEPIYAQPTEIPPRDADQITTTDTLPPYTPPIDPGSTGTGDRVADPPKPVPPLIAAEIDPRFAGDFQPQYPGPELRAQREGTATVRVHIGADGRVVAVEQVRATSAAFFEATRRQALAKWRFRPASRGGIAEDSWRTMTVHFVLTDG